MNVFEYTKELLSINSPTGFCNEINAYLIEFSNRYNFDYKQNNKGNIYIYPNGVKQGSTLVATHVDTLGLIVTSLKENARLTVDKLGGPILATLPGEYVTVICRDGRKYRGTIQTTSPAAHVHPKASDKVEIENLEIVLDVQASTIADLEKLGLQNGDIICLDTKTEINDEFIKSRFLDNKLCAGLCLFMLEEFAKGNVKFEKNVVFGFSTYEEVGHGMSHIDDSVSEILALDMACVGLHLSGNEEKVSICAKDSSGPYDYNFISELANISKLEKIDYAIDVYPMYGSDASAALRGGNDIRAALIGPGVYASHGVERSHQKGVLNTFNLLKTYLETK